MSVSRLKGSLELADMVRNMKCGDILSILLVCGTRMFEIRKSGMYIYNVYMYI